MRPRRLILVLFALVLATGAAAAGGGMTVSASTHAVAAKNVRVTAVMRYEMQCAYPGIAPARVTWPGSVPAHVASTAVLVNGKPAQAVSVRGHVVSVGMPPRPQVMCDVIGPARLTIVFTSRADLANPAVAGTRAVIVNKGAMHFSADLAIH